MSNRRNRLLSFVLAVGMTITSVIPSTVLAAAADDGINSENSKPAASEEDPGGGTMADYHGLAAEYYTTSGSGTNVTLSSLKSKGVDYNIDFAELDGKLMEMTGQDDYAGIRWTGRIQVPETGSYRFYGYSDNGLRVWVDNKQLINYWDGDSWDVLQTSSEVTLEAGQEYEFKAEYFDYVGGSHAVLSWTNNQSIGEKTVIPASVFYLPKTYDGVYISGIDTADANLVEGEEFGTIRVGGLGLDQADFIEVVNTSGTSLSASEPVYAEISSVSPTAAEITIPALSIGAYKLKAVIQEQNLTVVSRNSFSVKPNEEELAKGNARTNEIPRKDWNREDYVNLNGWWQFEFDETGAGKEERWYDADHELSAFINVPFCWESSLGGIGNEDYKGEAWYRRTVTIDNSWNGKKIFLKFGAVDWKCKLYVNGEAVKNGEHIGGYSAFEVDVTDYMNVGENVITLWVEDRGNYGDDSYPALVGKQGRNAPCGYIHTSGIWQTVGMEARSTTWLDHARAAVDVDNSQVNYALDITSDAAQTLTIEYRFESTLYDAEKDETKKTGSTISGSQQIAVETGSQTVSLDSITVENPKLWNYNTPNLYEGALTVKDENGAVLDQVSTYFGMRKVEAKYYDESLGVQYIYINDKPVYMSGLLDQGFWEEGIYTAPSEEALKFDIQAMKNNGFNMIRKHLKIEDPLQYYWCDKLGMLVWQDMPHATNMVPSQNQEKMLGRQYYEECLDSVLRLNYNYPSVVAVMLFNETWGLQDGYWSDRGSIKASDGMDTFEWVTYLYHKTKSANPNILVEDMSACNQDHIQPTDLNTYHMYPASYRDTVNAVNDFVNNSKPGSGKNFRPGYQQDGDPLLNSEYGGVGAYAGDYDVSHCFKYMTDIQRRYIKQSGFVYTEPYDVEYERNGILTYDRKEKIFGYDEVAYGGDMSMKDLLQEIYIGVESDPILNVAAGQLISTNVLALCWTDEIPKQASVNWRFDGTDIYGNHISTGLSGTLDMALAAYQRTEAKLSFQAPDQACVGTLTVWIEDGGGEKVAKNFVNISVTDDTSKNADMVVSNKDGSTAIKAKVSGNMATEKANEAQSYTYKLPNKFNLDDLTGLRVLAEVSSYKGVIGTDKNKSSYASECSQTAEGRERPSDLTIFVNGVELDTVFLPDNPRDVRGTLTMNAPYCGSASAGDFGYLVNLNVTEEKLAEIKSAVGEDKQITVTYAVKEDAANQNGLRIYSSTYGRYAVDPTIILNPKEIESEAIVTADKKIVTASDNYSVEGTLSAGADYTLRTDADGGYTVAFNADGSRISVVNKKTNEKLAEAELTAAEAHEVKVTLFDDQIRVYADHAPEPVINIYDYSGFTGGVQVHAGGGSPVKNLVISPESYIPGAVEIVSVPTTSVEDDFTDPDYENRYEISGDDWRGSINNGKLAMSAGAGGKAIMKDVTLADGVVQMEVTVTNANGSRNGNAGFVFRGTDFIPNNPDGARGYYAGIGDGYVQVGRMNHNWTELAKVTVPGLNQGTTHILKVAVFGSRIQVYIDDAKTPCVDLTDSAFSDGGVAIRGFQVSATLDDVKVTNAPDYQTGFSNGAGEWKSIGSWKTSNGAYTSDSAGSYALVNSQKIEDLIYSADLTLADRESGGALLVRASQGANGQNGYGLAVDAKSNQIKLIKIEDNTVTVLKEGKWPLKWKAGKAYRFTVEVKGQIIKAYAGDYQKAFLIAEDDTFEAGRIGVINLAGTVSVDNIRVNHRFIDGSQLVFADKETLKALDDAKAAAEALDAAEYTEESYAKVTEALDALEQVDLTDQAAVQAAVQALQNAIAALEKKSPELPTEDDKAHAAAKKALEDTLAAAKAVYDLGQKNYTDASWNAFKDAYEKAVKGKDSEKTDELNALKDALAAAKAGLKETDKEQPGQNPPGQNPPGQNPPVQELKAGQTVDINGIRYKVTNAAKKTAAAEKGLKKNATSVNIAAAVTVSGVSCKVTSISANAFKNFKNVKSVAIGKNVTGIGAGSFYGCVKLAKVSISGKVTAIGKSSFYKCTRLTQVTIGSSVKTIGDSSFYGCTKLSKVIIGKNVTAIGKNCFNGCKKLKTVTIKGTKIKTIQSGAFKKTNAKIKVNLPKAMKAKKRSSVKRLLKKAGISSKASIK